jgi:hypothetical protein
MGMNFVTKIRMAVGNMIFIIQLRQPQKRRRVVSFDAARKIGMLYDATDDSDYETVKQYVKTLRGDHKEVLALGYVDRKELSRNQFSQLGLDFFTKKDLKWNMIPESLEVKNFIKEPFDILINLNEGNCFPLNYITALSKAQFRIGRYNKNLVHNFDMMIDAGNSTSLANFIKETDRYLRIIKN